MLSVLFCSSENLTYNEALRQGGLLSAKGVTAADAFAGVLAVVPPLRFLLRKLCRNQDKVSIVLCPVVLTTSCTHCSFLLAVYAIFLAQEHMFNTCALMPGILLLLRTKMLAKPCSLHSVSGAKPCKPVVQQQPQ